MMVNSMYKTAFALTVLAVSSASVMAADTVDLKVKGTIAPFACVPTLSAGGVVDYGNLTSEALALDDYTTLDVKELDLSIACNGPAKIAIKLMSNRQGSAAGAGSEGSGGFAAGPVDLFNSGASTTWVAGLGLSDDGAKIGGYAVRLVSDSVLVDAVAVDTISASMAGNSWRLENDVSMTVNGRKFSWADVGTLNPVAVNNLSAKFETQAYINKASELDITKDIALDGSSTLEVMYL